MKGLDIFVVRFIPFIIFALFLFGTIYTCIVGEAPILYYFHSNSAPYALALFLISLANKRYHCIYNRAMYVFLILVPIINYLEVKFNLFRSDESFVFSMIIITTATIIVTAYLAIKHFITISKRKLKNGSNQ